MFSRMVNSGCKEGAWSLRYFLPLSILCASVWSLTACAAAPVQDAGTPQITKKRFLGQQGIPSVTHDGIRYQALRWGKERGLGQNGGYLVALQESSGEELWLLKIYEVYYDGEMEADKQDVFITDLSMSWFGSTLTIKNERGQRFKLDLETRQVRSLAGD